MAITRPKELKVEDTEGLRYEIKLDNNDEVYDDIPASEFGSDGVTYFWFRDLEPETKYRVFVHAYNENGRGSETSMNYENTAGNFIHAHSGSTSFSESSITSPLTSWVVKLKKSTVVMKALM